MKSLYDFTLQELQDEMVGLNQKPYRATQIYSWLYQIFDILGNQPC